LLILLIGAAALLGFAAIGEGVAVAAHAVTRCDGTVRGWMLAQQNPVAHRIFLWITIFGGITAMRVVAIAAGLLLLYAGSRAASVCIVATPFVANALFSLAKRSYARPRPRGLGGPVESSYSFPSGHATVSAAVCATLAYVLWREGFIRGHLALALATGVPILVGISRLYLDLHWATDVLGGWCAGVFVAVVFAALYNVVRRLRTVMQVAAVAFLALSPRVARAQVIDDHSGIVITGRDLGLIGGATLASGLLTRVDGPVARFLADSAFHARHPGFTTAAKRASVATETLFMVSGGVIYAVARMRKDGGTADVALHTTESVLFPAMFIQVIRGALGRARPYVIDDAGEKRDADPYDFELLHGFTSFNYRSFPSMHAMASVAVATALSQEMRERDTPHRELISPLLYVAAAAPPLARMYLDEHWTSDIIMGAFLGAFAGQKVVTYSHEHPHNRIDNAFLGRRLDIGISGDARGMSLFVVPE
jgi:undecaprenyl-diphosphatase